MSGSVSLMEPLDKKAVYLLLNNDGTYATVLHTICLRSYGEEVYDLDPLELIKRLEEDYGGRLSDSNENKLNAIFTATTTDAFYHDKDAFTAVCNTLSSGDPGLDLLDDLTVPEIFWAIYEVETNRPAAEFSRSIMELVDRNIMEEAADNESAEDLFNYVLGYLRDSRDEMAGQFNSLGIDGNSLPPVEPPKEILADSSAS